MHHCHHLLLFKMSKLVLLCHLRNQYLLFGQLMRSLYLLLLHLCHQLVLHHTLDLQFEEELQLRQLQWSHKLNQP